MVIRAGLWSGVVVPSGSIIKMTLKLFQGNVRNVFYILVDYIFAHQFTWKRFERPVQNQCWLSFKLIQRQEKMKNTEDRLTILCLSILCIDGWKISITSLLYGWPLQCLNMKKYKTVIKYCMFLTLASRSFFKQILKMYFTDFV